MAQTKRKRRTKHRGNAAGMVETRGRTGRPLTTAESAKATAAERREDRLNRPPSWQSAATRAGIATGIFFILVLVLFKQPIGAAIALALFTFTIYVPLGYYTDLFLYRRRQAKKLQADK
jgi:hypothetical protein